MTATATPDLGQLQLLDLSKVEISKFNPRQDVGDLTELTDSIGQIGVLEPIVVVQRNGHYEAVAGSRRTAAARQAGLKQIPARIMSLDDAQQAAAALIENLQRKDLTPLEEAEAFRKYLDLTGCTQKELGQKIGRAPSTIANALRLLEAPTFVKDALRGKTLTPAHARVLLQVKDPAQYDVIAKDLGKRAEKVTVDELQEMVQDVNDNYATSGPAAVAAAKAFLEEARGKHPKATITWKAQSKGWQDVVDLVETLGAPPANFAGPIRSGEQRVESWQPGAAHPTAAMHAKHCDCSAYVIEVERVYGGAFPPDVDHRLKFKLTRVCIVAANYKKAKPPAPNRLSSSTSSTTPKALTPQQQAKRDADLRKHAEAQVAKEFANVAKPAEPRFAPIFAKLRKGQIPADVARALAYVGLTGYLEGPIYGDGAQMVAWERIEKMPAKKVSELAANVLADAIQSQLRSADDDDDRSVAAAYFGVKLQEPKAKKKTKR